MHLNRRVYRQLVNLLSPLVTDTHQQQAFTSTAFFGSSIVEQVEVGGAPRDFAARLVRICAGYGQLEDGEEALAALMDELFARVGSQKQAQIEQIRNSIGQTAPSQAPLIETQPQIIESGLLLSYLYDALNEKNWQRAEALLEQLRERPDLPSYFDLRRYQAQVEHKIQQETWQRMAAKAYELLRVMARYETPEHTWEALLAFWEQFPGYDPDNLGHIGREIEYERVREHVRRGELEAAWHALEVFWEYYPDYDPDHLADYLLRENDGHREALRRIQQAQATGASSLDLSGLGLYNVPDEIGQLKDLRTLSLARNYLTHIPRCLAYLRHLEELSLAGNRLERLDQNVTSLVHLRSLSLNDNALTDLPSSIVRLQNLKKLHLQQNQITHLPRQIGQLVRLELLDLGKNQLQHLPIEMARLARLKWLFLNNNGLTRLPVPVVGLMRLGWLFLHGNRLVELPAEIAQLHELKWLTVGDNCLLDLPHQISLLTHLEHLSVVRGNPLSGLPAEVVQRGDKAVLAWLQQHVTSGGRPR